MSNEKVAFSKNPNVGRTTNKCDDCTFIFLENATAGDTHRRNNKIFSLLKIEC